jgi:hypothetical protein
MSRYIDFTELTILMLNEFVERIIIHKRDNKGQIELTQKVEIHLNFIGEYLPPSMEAVQPTPEDEKELRKVMERCRMFRQNYLKRKAGGKQKEYEQRYNEKRKAMLVESKAALFENGAVLGAGVLAPVGS